jgi:hypothetical protein
MTNRLIELHDTTVLSVTTTEGNVIIAMSAYVHASTGRAGIDAGTGWTQPARFTVLEGCVVRRHEGDQLWILDGMLTVGGEVFDNMVPTDVIADGDVKLVFSGAEGVLEVVGGGLRVEVTGEATYVEDFSGGG